MLRKIYNWSSSWTGTIVIVLTIIFFIAQAFVIPSGSMKNTLLIGDMLFVKKFSYGVPIPRIPWFEIPIFPDLKGNGHIIEGDRPKRGDIVVFYAPHEKARGRNIHYVKRAVAVGGDIVMISDKKLLLHPNEGNDYVKKNYKENEYVSYDSKLWIVSPYKKDHPGIHTDPKVTKNNVLLNQLFNLSPIKIPEDEFFMMGDNRDHSNDSRFWGTVPYEYVVGTPWIIYFSWSEDKEIRWDRVLRTVESIEKDMQGKEQKINHKEGIY